MDYRIRDHIPISILIGVFLLLQLSLLFPQQEQYRLEQIPLTGDLLNFKGSCILQDKEGFMWFGSQNGLYRYDGIDFKVYRHDPFDAGSIPLDNIIFLAEDDSCHLWVGTTWGLASLDICTERFDRSPYDNYCRSGMHADQEGNIWLGGFTGTLSKYETESGTMSEMINADYSGRTQGNSIWGLLMDRYGSMWLLNGQNGFFKFDGKTKTLEEIDSVPCNLTGLYEDSSGRLWVTSHCGLYNFNRITRKFEQAQFKAGDQNPLINHTITGLIEDQGGNLWVRTLEGIYKFSHDLKLLFRWDAQEGYDPIAVESSIMGSLYEDNMGTIWFFDRNGIYKLVKEWDNFTSFDPEPPSSSINSCIYLVNDDSLLYCNWSEYYYAYNRKKNLIARYSLPSIHAIIKDSRGDLWFGTSSGLYRCKTDGKIEEYIRYQPVAGDPSSLPGMHINYIFEDSGGRIWIACRAASPCYYDRDQDCFIQLVDNPGCAAHLSFASQVRYETNQAELWAINSGVYKIIPPFIKVSDHSVMPSDIIEFLAPNPKGLNLSNFYTTHQDQTGALWLGDKAMGLFKMTENTEKNPGVELENYTVKDGLPSNFIVRIQEDKRGNLWLGTINGLSKFDPLAKTFTNFNEQDGIPINRFQNASAINSRGEIFFGTTRGMISFHPDSIWMNTRIPPVKLTGIRVHNQEIIPSDSSILRTAVMFSNELKLRYNQNTLTFSFAVLNYIQPELNQYKYMLVGLERDWVFSGKRNTVTYAGLRHGSYIFRACGSNNDGIWNEEGATLSVYIQPPPWLSWWAYTCYFLLLSGIGILIWRYLVNRAKMHTALEIERIEKENVRELDHMKSRFFANISHEFRTPLTLIEGPVNDLLKSEGGLINQERQLLTLVKRNSRKLHRLINQLLEISKLEKGRIKLEVSKGDLSGFLRSIALSYLSLAERHGIRYQVEVNNYPEPFLFDRDKLEKITTNLLSNAFKFTPHGGSVRLSLIYLPNPTTGLISYAKIIVSDTGPGIPAKEQDKVFDRFYQVLSHEAKYTEGTGIGLALVKELVDLYRGEIQLESNTGIGSTFSVILPVSRNSFKADEIVDILSGISEDVIKETLDFEEPVIQEHSDIDSGKMDKDAPEILIVEDNTDLRYYMKQHLASEYRVCEAENGMEGLSAAIEFLPDLVITDLMMPIMDGREMCKRLKNDERTSHIPIIILTAKADKKSKMEGLETGADDYLFKPFDMEELKVRTRNLIQQREKLREKFKREFITMPKDPKSISPGDKLLLRIINVLHQNLEDPEFNIENIFTELHISRAQLFRKVQAMTSFTPKELLRNLRLKKAASLFDSGYDNVTQVMFAVGFNNHSHFAKCFRDLYGENPSAYKKRLVK